jgi:hypothetical protein
VVLILFLDFKISSSLCIFLAALMTFDRVLQYLLYRFLRFLSLLFLQFKYNVLLLWNDIFIPLVIQGVYVCLEWSFFFFL